MAWAVFFENSIGPLFPDGDFTELRERLHTHFTQEMSAEERAIFGHEVSYVHWVFEKFTKEIGILHPADRAVLTSPQQHEWPRTFQANRKIRSLGSLFKTTSSVLAVDETMKSLIEVLEPGIHKFRPITFLQPNSETVPGNYFTTIIGQFRDSFIPEPETEGRLWKRSSYLDSDGVRKFSGAYTLFPVKQDVATEKEAYARVPFSSTKIAGAHLWRERHLTGPNFYISDTLHDAIKNAKLKMLPQVKVKEV